MEKKRRAGQSSQHASAGTIHSMRKIPQTISEYLNNTLVDFLIQRFPNGVSGKFRTLQSENKVSARNFQYSIKILVEVLLL